VLTVVLPMIGAALGVFVHRWKTSSSESEKQFSPRDAVMPIVAFTLGVVLTIGPWLMKNLSETGNPVYPLLYSMFGGVDWDDAVNARWNRAHSPDTYNPVDLGVKCIDVTTKSDWQSFLAFGFAPLAVLGLRQVGSTKSNGLNGRSVAKWLTGYAVFLFLAWWIFTHRLDRFWIPMIPIVAVLAGIGISWQGPPIWLLVRTTLILATLAYNLTFITTPLCGLNDYLTDIDRVRTLAESKAPGIAHLNTMDIPDDQSVLMVGEAQVFDARFKLVYNTVFDESIFQTWCAVVDEDLEDGELTMRSVDQIRQTLADNQVGYIFVNWNEILRYRPTYGYTDFVTPKRFQYLLDNKIIEGPLADSVAYRELEGLSQRDLDEVKKWAPELIDTVQGTPVMITRQLFRVRSSN